MSLEAMDTDPIVTHVHAADHGRNEHWDASLRVFRAAGRAISGLALAAAFWGMESAKGSLYDAFIGPAIVILCVC